MIKIITIAGIPIKIHWSFVLILFFIVGVVYKYELNTMAGLFFLVFVAVLFLFVILHEYGHALMARRFRIKTRDIIITPIGGIARLEGMPKQPTKEFMVAIAGPFVNLIFALGLFGVLYFLDTEDYFLRDKEGFEIFADPIGFITLVAIMNSMLFLFNLIPAYPMDGGRILRALLSMIMSRSKATIYSANLGRILAIGFILLGTYNKLLTLIMIGFFIYFVATREYEMEKINKAEDALIIQN